MSVKHKDSKVVRKVWLDYMKMRFSKIHGPFLPKTHIIREDGSVTTKKNLQGNTWVYEDVGVDYRTFRLKYRTTGIVPVPFKMSEESNETPDLNA